MLFNDAGIGLEQAGVAGVLALAGIGMAAAGVDCQSCEIGSAADTLENGVISVVNTVAETLGIIAGMPVATAVSLLENAPIPQGKLPPHPEARQSVQIGGVSVELGISVKRRDSEVLVFFRSLLKGQGTYGSEAIRGCCILTPKSLWGSPLVMGSLMTRSIRF